MRVTILAWTVAFIAALIVQSTLVHTIAVAGIKPDLIIIVLFLFAMKFGVLPGIYVGFILGLGVDLYSPSVLGQNALAKTVVGAFAGVFNDRMIRTEPVVKIVILLVSFLVHDALFLAAQAAKTPGTFMDALPILLTTSLPRSLYSVVLIVGFYIWDANAKHSTLR